MSQIVLSKDTASPPDPRDLNAWKGVWVISEPAQGELPAVTAELLSKGRELSDRLGVDLACVLLGHGLPEDQIQDAVSRGADRVLVLDHPELADFRDQVYGDVIAALARLDRPEIILAPSTTTGRAYIPRVATMLETGLTADCMGLDINENNVLVQTRPTFGGNLMAGIVCPAHRPQMATVRPHVLKPLPEDRSRKGSITRYEPGQDLLSSGIRVLESIHEEIQGPDICQSDVVVTIGRGVESEEYVNMAQELASLLGGCIGATRPVVDAGWASENFQIGQTGVTISPKLYIGLGVSGAIHHTVGIRASEIIVAVNKDPNAPIFDMATYGIVGDVKQILPLLIKSIKERRC